MWLGGEAKQVVLTSGFRREGQWKLAEHVRVLKPLLFDFEPKAIFRHLLRHYLQAQKNSIKHQQEEIEQASTTGHLSTHTHTHVYTKACISDSYITQVFNDTWSFRNQSNFVDLVLKKQLISMLKRVVLLKGDLTHTVSPNLMLILSTYRVVLHPSYLQKVFSFIIFIKERYRFTILSEKSRAPGGVPCGQS